MKNDHEKKYKIGERMNGNGYKLNIERGSTMNPDSQFPGTKRHSDGDVMQERSYNK
ncbi:hypothetical protein [Alteribacter aurantiacus]|uniref:hypothetical protein n=1 Tax=Alteribacter aurantiacus TaxID=254410 RepID=UPI00041EC535|nr:hypothetical protein [Alteribacter aurantiacus]